jgi:protein phosphatase
MANPDAMDSEPDRDRTSHSLSRLVQVDVAGLSDAGKVRARNEDHFFVARVGRFLEFLQTNLPINQIPSRAEDIGYGMAVADGMGGRAAGEEASRLALKTLVALALSTPDWIFLADDPAFADEIMRRASERYGKIDRTLANEAAAHPGLTGFGTTMISAVNVGSRLIVAHVGDSRAYLLRKGTLHQLTKDHTLARTLYEAGQITSDEVATHHLRHVLTQNLGGNRAIADVQKLAVQNGDRLLLCSDGLTDMVPDDQIAELLAEGKTSQEICQRLVDQALVAGGQDNVTVVVAQYRISENS